MKAFAIAAHRAIPAILTLALAVACQPPAPARSAPQAWLPEPATAPQSDAGVRDGVRDRQPAPAEFAGPNEVRVVNPNEFEVKVELQSRLGGKTFAVPANGRASAFVPNDHFEIFFEYSNEPDARYQGDSFSLVDQGIEIQIVKAIGGNYGVRRVE